ncbi:MAG: hypothetical protein AAF938_24715 [Myxococcota bacterium]
MHFATLIVTLAFASTASAQLEGEAESAQTAQTPASHTPAVDEEDTWHRDSERLRVDFLLGYSAFEQQVKSEIGGVSVEPLVQDRALELSLSATYGLWKYIRAGLFLQLDVGTRRFARFEGLSDGEPLISESTGGRYREFWIGPLLRFQWRGLAAEVGWGAFGVRSDRARNDLPTEDGGLAPLRTTPRVAWHFALSGYVPVHVHIDVVFRVQYRIRYYEDRGGEDLREGVAHGTQNLSPTVGVSWRL